MSVIRCFLAMGHETKSGEQPMYLSFYLKQEKVYIPCGMSVSPDNFDREVGKVKIGDKRHKDKNLLIDNIKARINNVMVKYRLRDKQLTKSVFLREYNRPSDFETFYEYVRFYMKGHPHEIENSTVDVHIDVINKLKRYKPTLYFDEITPDFLKDYKVYLKKKLENKDSTINKNLAVIKKYVRAAVHDGYMLENPFTDIKISRKINTIPVFLKEEELMLLLNLYRSGKLSAGRQSTLEVFLFMCFTSLHIGDVRRLKIEQLTGNSFTYYRLKNRNSKPDPIIVPLSNPAKALIKRIRKGRNRGLLFINMLPDQKMNFYLKEISHIAGIDKRLSCKSGRHTFATIFLHNTKDLPTLKEIMGHSDYRETLVYAHILEESRQQGIKCFNSFKVGGDFSRPTVQQTNI